MEIRDCTQSPLDAWPVMRQLRTHLDEAAYLGLVASMQGEGYRLAVGEEDGVPVAAAGFRFMTTLFRGKTLYVDDLVTDAASRSQGHGAAMMAWLGAQADAAGCAYLVLDSGVQRADAHRFYERLGMERVAFNFQFAR